MNAKDLNFQFLSKEELKHLLTPIVSKLESIDKKLNQTTSTQKKGYYRTKDLKAKLGLSPNTIIKYREAGIIPYTQLGDVYLYPIEQIEEILKTNSNLDLFFKKAS
ncbi:helix-turn-helix domain-containing protein [Aestuariibaculum sp. M13]|uniref:helix-turn-helix domain-containing protein n=1 Tax=Aestuariibaculum sp. M13 TaxID=2967132 RepID=UPI00215A0709|nr:helix-turn-helix domain-containing protein [Aestuariibaculum sp. M13]MCR8667938.1 helix-turn-helix domain-containing protein [Aestuariibaculum sp. M13]